MPLSAYRFFLAECLRGARAGGQHLYLLVLLLIIMLAVLGLETLIMTASGRLEEEALGRSGEAGVRLSMYSRDVDGVARTIKESNARDGTGYRVFAFSDQEIELPSKDVKKPLIAGRGVPSNHPIGGVIHRAINVDRVDRVGFFSEPQDRMVDARGYSMSLGSLVKVSERLPDMSLILSLAAIPKIDWESQRQQAPRAFSDDYHELIRLSRNAYFVSNVGDRKWIEYLYQDTEERACESATISDKDECREAHQVFRSWLQRQSRGGALRGGLFLSVSKAGEGDVPGKSVPWIRVEWVQHIPLPTHSDFLVSDRLLAAIQNFAAITECSVNFESKVRYLRLGCDTGGNGVCADPAARVAKLNLLLKACFNDDVPQGWSARPLGGDAIKLSERVAPAWLTGCAELLEEGYTFEVGAEPAGDSEGFSRDCGLPKHTQVDLYIPYGEDYRGYIAKVRKHTMLAPSSEAEDALHTLGIYKEIILDFRNWGLLICALLTLFALASLQFNLAMSRSAGIGQLRAHGMTWLQILAAGLLVDLVLAFVVICLAVIVVGLSRLFFTFPWWHPWAFALVCGVIVIHLGAGVFANYVVIVRKHPGDNLRLGY